jgi:hypothetical protein
MGQGDSPRITPKKFPVQHYEGTSAQCDDMGTLNAVTPNLNPTLRSFTMLETSCIFLVSNTGVTAKCAQQQESHDPRQPPGTRKSGTLGLTKGGYVLFTYCKTIERWEGTGGVH